MNKAFQNYLKLLPYFRSNEESLEKFALGVPPSSFGGLGVEHPGPFHTFFSYTKQLACGMEQIYQADRRTSRLLAEMNPFLRQRFLFYRAAADFSGSYALAGISLGEQPFAAIEGGLTGSHAYDGTGKWYRDLLHSRYPDLTTPDALCRLFLATLVKEPAMKQLALSLDLKGKLLTRPDSFEVSGPTGEEEGALCGFHTVVHAGHTPHPLIVQEIQQLCHKLWPKPPKRSPIPTLLRIGLFHFFLGNIHPFYDGNGRIARLVSLAQLCRHLDSLSCLGISVSLFARWKKYYRVFASCAEDEDLTKFLLYFLSSVRSAIDTTGTNATFAVKRYEEYQKQWKRLLPAADSKLQHLASLLLADAACGRRGMTRTYMESVSGMGHTALANRLKQIPPQLLLTETTAHTTRYRLAAGQL